MLVKQIATILNATFDTIIGESAVVNENLSNIVDVGKVITSNSTYEGMLDSAIGAIIDKVGLTVFDDRLYMSQSPNILKTGSEYGSIIEKIRVDIGDFSDNVDWSLNSTSFDSLFGYEEANVTAKYFNGKKTFRQKISLLGEQLTSAFQSADKMIRFFAMIENRVATKMTACTDWLIKATIVNLIAEKIKTGNNIVNLKTLYYGATAKTKDAMFKDKEFLRFVAKTIMLYKGYMKELSILYNDGEYATFTPEDALHIVMHTELDTAIKTNLYADTFNYEFVKLPFYETINYWQGTGTTNDDRMKINVLPASANGVKGESDANVVNVDNIVCVMFDDRACAVCNEKPKVTTQYNAEADFTNYFFKWEANYINDTAENCVVFTLN